MSTFASECKHGLVTLPAGGYLICIFSKRTEFLCTRARYILFFFSISLFFFSFTKKNTKRSKRELQFLFHFVEIVLIYFPDEDDWEVMIVLQSSRLFRNTKVLLDSHPFVRTPYRYCCRRHPKSG